MESRDQKRKRWMSKFTSQSEWSDDLMSRMDGRWLTMLAWAVSGLYGAAAYPGSRIRCPMHGGRIYFSFYEDSNKTGAGFCSACGGLVDGFAVLCHYLDIGIHDASMEVEEWLEEFEWELKSGRTGLLTAPEYQLPKSASPIQWIKRNFRRMLVRARSLASAGSTLG